MKNCETRVVFLSALMALVLGGCASCVPNSNRSDGGGTDAATGLPDASHAMDAHGAWDSGQETEDAGSGADGGWSDAGARDAGSGGDAGAGADAGNTRDAGNADSGQTADAGSRRAYAGAPPTMAHLPVGCGMNCALCHNTSGTYGPITPHPERKMCRQCHLPQYPVPLRVQNTFTP